MKKNTSYPTINPVDKASHKVGRAVKPAGRYARRTDTEVVVYKRKAQYDKADYVRSE
ncbi:hypothetical protein [Salipaludibacillus sp. CF4.18]|uniref:hypothetical protein n=1 Tax=Salipaludibacillus sp. CF4.18 TaxID=3373081 RepID=UPI003EE611AD